MGADVVYAAEHLTSLFKASAALLAPTASAFVLLCYTVRSVSEDAVSHAATAAGLTRTDLPDEIKVARAALRPQMTHASPMRIHIFKRSGHRPLL